VKTLTARAMTSPRMASEMTDCTAIAILAHGTSGIASVGLNAVACQAQPPSRRVSEWTPMAVPEDGILYAITRDAVAFPLRQAIK
jgi:hypothetical protein